MSTVHIGSGESGVSRPNHIIQTNSTTSGNGNGEISTTWLDSFTRVDVLLSGGLLHLAYRLIDIILLSIGLYYGKETCDLSNRLAITSICLLIFYAIDLAIISLFLIQNWSSRNVTISDEERLDRARRASSLRGFFLCFKLIPVCFGTAYSFTSTIPTDDNCELIRFCLGIVCLSTWLLMLIPPSRPELPVRRSMVMECVILLFVFVINGVYIGTVASAMSDVQDPVCTYKTIDDLYKGAPLKSFAYIGLILFGITTGIHVLNLAASRLFLRLTNGRTALVRYYAFQYALNYFGAIIVIYYFSIGALFLFQPRSGGDCRLKAPNLYKTLLIWEWIRVLSPLIAVPLIIVLCCVGVVFGIFLTYCLPASITVPLLEILRSWLPAAPVSINPNPPATQENIDALPVINFGQEPDQFNQTECAICRSNFEPNEQVKKLQCGHLFHSECVGNWLTITRICPICRRRMSLGNS